MIFKKIEKILIVDGMHCQKCIARITEALKSVDGVKRISIDLDSKAVSVISKTEIPLDTLKSVIEKLGFTVIS